MILCLCFSTGKIGNEEGEVLSWLVQHLPPSSLAGPWKGVWTGRPRVGGGGEVKAFWIVPSWECHRTSGRKPDTKCLAMPEAVPQMKKSPAPNATESH